MAVAGAGLTALWIYSRTGTSWLLLIGAVCVQLRLLCNLLDGMVAVEGGKKGRAGDLFNEIPDRFEDSFFLIGGGLACGNVALGLLSSLLAVGTAYVRAFGASLGHGQDFGGPCAKPQRMFLLTIGLLGAFTCSLTDVAIPILETTLWVIFAGTSLTICLRIRRLFRKLV